jgi:acyl-CoA dehydrogenase
MPDLPWTVLDVLAEKPDEPTWESLPAIWDAYAAERAAGRSPLSAAVAVAVRADRLGHAFAVGYPAALEHLLPGAPLPCALCATEAGGNSPRAIATTLEPYGDGYKLDGTKTFVTFGTLAEELIVVARAGDKPDGRPDIVVVRIPANRAGVTLEELPPTSFVPEIAHARVTLDGVSVGKDERLEGDGYLGYLKPFRTIEDIHVLGATLGYVIGWARRVGTSNELFADLCADLVVLDALLAAEPLDPRTHIVLHGAYRSVTGTLCGDGFASVLARAAQDEHLRWERDEKLLAIASKAREARFQAASKVLGLTVG